MSKMSLYINWNLTKQWCDFFKKPCCCNTKKWRCFLIREAIPYPRGNPGRPIFSRKITPPYERAPCLFAKQRDICDYLGIRASLGSLWMASGRTVDLRGRRASQGTPPGKGASAEGWAALWGLPGNVKLYRFRRAYIGFFPTKASHIVNSYYFLKFIQTPD